MANVLIGGVGALISWALYGSGATLELAAQPDARALISLKLPALAGALLVGVAGAKWLTSEADKGLLKESVKLAAEQPLKKEECEGIVKGSALAVLEKVEAA